jgi:hydroxymethylpyrimidine pyrophosphatase-like HAD family hydrolase
MEAWNATFECLDIVSEHASKLHGVVDVAKLMHLSTHEIIGVGDGYNDFPLLMACGLKIAMGNAVPELKAIADFVAPTVDEDGVATVIEKFILTG